MSEVHEEELPDGREPTDEEAVDNVVWKPKITIAQIGGNPAAAKSKMSKVWVATIVGMADGIKTVNNPMYPDVEFIALTGTFMATNRDTGVSYRSGIVYLPSGFHEAVIAQLSRQLAKENKESAYENVLSEFALDIYAVPSGNPSGYSYEATSLMPPDKKEPVRRLMRLADVRRAKLLALEHKKD